MRRPVEQEAMDLVAGGTSSTDQLAALLDVDASEAEAVVERLQHHGRLAVGALQLRAGAARVAVPRSRPSPPPPEEPLAEVPIGFSHSVRAARRYALRLLLSAALGPERLDEPPTLNTATPLIMPEPTLRPVYDVTDRFTIEPTWWERLLQWVRSSRS